MKLFEISFNRDLWRYELRNVHTNRLSSYLEFSGQTSVPMSLAQKAAGKHPEVTSRVFRAAVLVSNGAVKLIDQPDGYDGATVAIVTSQEEPGKRYIISRYSEEVYVPTGDSGEGRRGFATKTMNRYTCTCHDFQDNQPPRITLHGITQPFCKHILAAEMAARMQANAAVPEWVTERYYKAQAAAMNYDDLRAKEDRGELLTDDELIFLESEEEKARSERQAAAAARRGPNVYERWRKQAHRDGDGARQYIRMAMANGTKTVPGHIYKRATGEA